MRWASTAFCSRSITRSPKTRPAPNDCRRPPFDMPSRTQSAIPFWSEPGGPGDQPQHSSRMGPIAAHLRYIAARLAHDRGCSGIRGCVASVTCWRSAIWFSPLTLARDRGFADSALEEAGFELVWGFSCQVVVFGLLQFFVRSGKGRSSSRRLRSGSRSARKGSRDRNGSQAWRLGRLASLVFRSALTPEHAEGR
jgi:hypothetical protein